VFGSARHLGEAANGNWTLTVKDLAAVDTGTFQSWSLKFYGR
jgi:kexin